MRLSVCVILLSLATIVIGGDSVYIAFCSNGFLGDEWVNQFKKTFDDTIVVFEPDVHCEGVMNHQVAVGLRDTTDGEYNVVIRKEKTSIPGYINSILKKLSDRHVTNVNIDNGLKNVKEVEGMETFVTYVARVNSIEHQIFQQAVLSHSIPKNVNIYVTHNEYTLPHDAKSAITGSLHVWLVREGQWSLLLLPAGSPTPQEIRENMASVLKILAYPPIHEYADDDYEAIYEASGLRYVLVFHKTSQRDDAYQQIIKPIMDIVRPHFIFIVIDVDVYPEMLSKHYVSEDNLPYIITRQHGQKSGVHIDRKYIPYTKDSLIGLLKSMVDPKVNNVDSPRTDKRQRAIISLTKTDVSTIKVLVKREKDPFIATFCNRTHGCNKLYKKMQRASDAISSGEFKISMFVVECDSIEEVTDTFEITELPQVLIMSDNDWRRRDVPAGREYTVANFIKLIEKYAVNVNEDIAPTLDHPALVTNTEHFFPASTVDEDEIFAVLYQKDVSMVKDLYHLTTDNYRDFMDKENGLVVFYLRYCIQCKPLFKTIFSVAEALEEENVAVSAVDCGDYPNVCADFSVYIYPSIKYRLSGGDWQVYTGIASNDELLKLVEPRRDSSDPIRPLTPASLIDIYSANGLDSLRIFCSPDLTADHVNVLSDVDNIYWLNSTLYAAIADGLMCVHAPSVVYANYIQKSLYKLELLESTTSQDVHTFFERVTQGQGHPVGIIDSPSWQPLHPPIEFPSKAYNHAEVRKQRRQQKKRSP